MRKLAIILACLTLGFAAMSHAQKDETPKQAKACNHGHGPKAGKCEGSGTKAGKCGESCKICLKCGELKGSEKCCNLEGREKCDKCGLLKGSPGCCNIQKGKCGGSRECKNNETCKSKKGTGHECKGDNELKGHDTDNHEGHNH